MAVKNSKQTSSVQTDSNEPANGAANSAADSTPVKRGPKGPRTTAPFTWTREMETAFVQVMSSPKKEREIRTASWVSSVLNLHPAFASAQVTAQQVNSHVEALRVKLPKNGLAVPPWLALDVVKRAPLDVDFWSGIAGVASAGAGAGAAE